MSNFVNGHPAFQVLFEADNGVELQQKIGKEGVPDVILMDINMPLMDGYDATAWLRQRYPAVKVLALSMYDSESCVINMLKCGAKGYLLKDEEPEILIHAMKEVHSTGFYFSPLVSKPVTQLLNDVSASASGRHYLTDREVEMIYYMATEMTYKQIADKMFLSIKTIEGYRETICEKLEVKTRIGVVISALKQGIIEL